MIKREMSPRETCKYPAPDGGLVLSSSGPSVVVIVPGVEVGFTEDDDDDDDDEELDEEEEVDELEELEDDELVLVELLCWLVDDEEGLVAVDDDGTLDGVEEGVTIT